MNEIINEKFEKEQKLITKFIFQGLTIAEIAKRLKCSQSTVSNRMTDLFEKYNAKTKFEFILGVLGEIVRNNKTALEENVNTIEKLKSRINDLTSILKNLILNKNDEETFDYWLKEAEARLL